MASMKKASVVFFLLVSLLFVSSGVLEGATCTSPSKLFKGPCGRDSNCRTVCSSEGFADGDCHGLRRRCLCKKPC